MKIRRFDEARGWARQGAESCAHWLSWRVGIGLFTARQKIAVAHRLLEFPLVAEAFRHGQLSYTKVRAKNMPPEKDEVLLHQALGASGAQMEKISAAHPPTPHLDDHGLEILRNRHHAEGIAIDHRTNLVRHNGSGLDLHAAVSALFCKPVVGSTNGVDPWAARSHDDRESSGWKP